MEIWNDLGGSRLSAPDTGGTGFAGSLPAGPWLRSRSVCVQQAQFGSKENIVFVFTGVFVTEAPGESTFLLVWIKDFFKTEDLPPAFSRFRVHAVPSADLGRAAVTRDANPGALVASVANPGQRWVFVFSLLALNKIQRSENDSTSQILYNKNICSAPHFLSL